MTARRPLAAVAALLLAAPPAVADEPPAALIEVTEQASAACRELGGTPSILDGYEIIRDLNGDGQDDFLTDLAYLQCADAWSAFCGSGGCPVSAWLSEPGGTFTRFDFGYLQGVEVRDRDGALPEVVAHYHGTFCDDPDRIGADGCTRTWVFATNAPEQPPVDPEPGAGAEAAPAAPPPPGLTGWTLRHVPGASPVALGAGVGTISSLAAFCLQAQPFLAVTFREAPKAEKVRLDFAFSAGPVEVPAGLEPTAGGAYVVALAGSELSARLGGRDTEVAVSVDGAAQGLLSLVGSTKALRGALADCRPK